MNPDDFDQSLRDHLGDTAPEAVQRRMEVHFQDLAASLRTRADATARPRRRSPLLWLWAGLSLAGTAAVIVLTFALMFAPSPTWAQVAERFRSLRFFNATVFFTENSGQPPEKIDLWVAQDHRLRAHYRGLIFFGSDGRITQVLSAKDGAEVPLEDISLRLRSRTNANDPYPALALVRGIARLGEMREFSLKNLLQLFSSSREELQATRNTDDNTAGDMQVFDFAGDKGPEWVRMWVLKKSELPVRLRVWDPTDGGQTDLLFDYATRMPEEAFDASRVQTELRGKQGSTNRLFALLPDSGGRPITPEQLFAARGYHLPDVDTVGRTPEGVVWVLSRNVENRRPDGERVFGWSRLTDNLGQAYTHRVIGWMPADNSLLEYFVPTDLDGSFKLPKTYTLTCSTRVTEGPAADNAPDETIGTLPVGNWRETTSIPDLMRARQNQIDGRTNWQLMAMDEAAVQQEWDKFDRTAAEIPGNPETDLVALARDVKRTHKLMLTRQRDAAAVLCTRLYPLVQTGVKDGQPLYTNIVRWHIADLYRRGQHTEARVLANRHAAEAIKRGKADGPQFVIDLMIELRLAGLSEADAGTFFDNNVAGLPSVRQRLEKTRFLREQPAEDASAGDNDKT